MKETMKGTLFLPNLSGRYPGRRKCGVHRALLSAIAALPAMLLSPPSLSSVTWEDIARDAETPENVLMYGMGPKAQRYSQLTAINTDNVKMLTPAWSFSFGDEKQRGQESQALVYEGVIYVTGSYSRVFAWMHAVVKSCGAILTGYRKVSDPAVMW